VVIITKPSWPKRHAVACTVAILDKFCVKTREVTLNPSIPPAVMQCCQEAEIPDKKLKRSREKKVGRKNSWPKFGQMFLKVAERGQKEIF
jgi:hypothetical protein